jgi:AraC family transcriptional regulator
MDTTDRLHYQVLARTGNRMALTSTSRLDVRSLWRGAGMELVSTNWRRGRHPAASESASDAAAIEFMLAGSFRKEAAGEAVVGDANNAVIFQPGERFCVDHPTGAGNAGLTIRFDPALWRATANVEHHSWAIPAGIFAQVSTLAAELRGAQQLDACAIEERVIAMIAELLDQHGGTALDAQRRCERDRVRAAQAYLNGALDRAVSLEELAALVDWSRWHLVRAFQRHTGVSPYRYHTRLRLRAACREVLYARQELTMVALRFGFSSHSHFTAAFRREFGVPPSAMRKVRRRAGATGT